MAKDPAFLFYTGDFATGTQFFNNEQVGVYIRLLMAQHQHGRLSEKQVKIICPNYDYDVISKFEKDEQGFFYNKRLEEEISKRKAFSESRSKNKKGKTKEVINTSKSYDNHMEDENENKDEIKKEIKKESQVEFEILDPYPFEIFWNTYDKKKGHADCEKKFKKLNQAEKEKIWQHVPAYVASTPDKQYRMNPETYLNGKHWNDEIINPKTGTNATGPTKQTAASKMEEYIRNKAASGGYGNH